MHFAIRTRRASPPRPSTRQRRRRRARRGRAARRRAGAAARRLARGRRDRAARSSRTPGRSRCTSRLAWRCAAWSRSWGCPPSAITTTTLGARALRGLHRPRPAGGGLPAGPADRAARQHQQPRRRGAAQAAGIESTVIPNVFEFEAAAGRAATTTRRSLRGELGMGTHDLLVVQPTRVVPRKGIELAIELVHRLDDPHARPADHQPGRRRGARVPVELHVLAEPPGVDLRYGADRFGPRALASRRTGSYFSVTDSYVEADLITYPEPVRGLRQRPDRDGLLRQAAAS